jgi:hypothetical protein
LSVAQACTGHKTPKNLLRSDVENDEVEIFPGQLRLLQPNAKLPGDLVMRFGKVCWAHGRVKLGLYEHKHLIPLDASVNFSFFFILAIFIANRYLASEKPRRGWPIVERKCPQFL